MKITDKMISNAYDLAKTGNFNIVICKTIGLSLKEYEFALKKGEVDLEDALINNTKKSEFAKLYEVVTTGEAEAEQGLVDYIENASISDWKAASWLLERRFSDRWQLKKDDKDKDKDKNIVVNFSNIGFKK